MDVKIESVYLKFPLNLSMSFMSAVQDGDTLVSAGNLDVSVKLWPLFKGKAEVDDITLSDTKLNTKKLIEACEIKGFVREISLDSHSTDLTEQLAVVNKALISDANLSIELNDSVPEDTTKSEPVTWKLQLEDIQLNHI